MASERDQTRLWGQGRIFRNRGSRRWQIAYCVRGTEVRESSHSADRKDAERLLRQRLAELGADRLGLREFVTPSHEKTHVKELLDALEADYSLRGGRALPSFKSHMLPIREYFGERRAIDISEETVDRFIKARLAEGRKPATVNKETALLNQAFRLGIRRKVVTTSPHFRKLREDNVRSGFFDVAEFDAVVQHLPDPIDDVARFAFASAWRKGEILGLTWSAVDRAGGEIRLRTSKNGRGRVLPLVGQLKAVLERRWGKREVRKATGEIHVSEFVFHRHGRPIVEFRKVWAAACKEAGIEGRHFHDLRRSGVRNLIRAGVSQVVAMAISGHRTVSIFNRYNITSGRDLVDALQKTERYVKTQPRKPTILRLKQPSAQSST